MVPQGYDADRLEVIGHAILILLTSHPTSAYVNWSPFLQKMLALMGLWSAVTLQHSLGLHGLVNGNVTGVC